MKDKKSIQIKAKLKHKLAIADLKSSRRGEPKLDRSAPVKLEKPLILIVCEGKNTEPSYFGHFKLSSATIKALGNGNNTLSLVKQVIEINSKDSYEQVWCVFDKDSFSAVNFNKAVALAKANNFGIAYSNQAFEYWLILHFEDHQGGAMSRKEYDRTLNKYIKPLGASFEGNGNKKISEDFFELLNGIDIKTGKSRIDLAIKRAKRNYNLFDHKSPSKEESSTTVFSLIEEIKKYI